MKLSMLRRSSGALLALTFGLVTLTVGAPVAAEPARPNSPQQLASKTVSVSVGATHIQQTMSQITVRRADGTEAPVSALEAPGCWHDPNDSSAPTNWSITVDWLYDIRTRVTQSSTTTWSGETACQDMTFISISSNVWFRNEQRSAGFYDSCGDASSPFNHQCGDADTAGIWQCAGAGNCSGGYHASYGWSWVLPTGWEWINLPVGCIKLSQREALCQWSTRDLFVPHLN